MSFTVRTPSMFLVMLVAAVFGFIWHVSVGAKSLPFSDVVNAFLRYDPAEFSHIIVREIRLPRAQIAVLVGASLSVAGALMQGVTRNPLADPGLLGLLSGASLALVASVTLFGSELLAWMPLVAATGALIAAVLVWLIASKAPGGATPLTLTLAGATVSAFLLAIISIIHLIDQETFASLRLWLVGSLAAGSKEALYWSAPWLMVGLAFAILLGPSVTALSMGDETASGLGINTARRKLQLLLCVVVLTAASVALAGPLAFIGLVVPHVARLFVGSDYRWIVPFSALLGAAYLLGVDTLARVALRPVEFSTGLLTAMLGAPLLMYLVRVRLR